MVALVNRVQIPLALTLVLACGVAQATLLGRDLDDTPTTAEAYYDTVLGITWLADANYFETSGAGEGLAQLGVLQNWTNNLVLGGYLNWRLPRSTPADGVDWDIASLTYDGVSSDIGYNHSSPGNELGYMFHVNLGNQGARDVNGVETTCATGGCLVDTGPFINIQPERYGTASQASFIPYFRMNDGFQGGDNGRLTYRGWAVHDGDIGDPTVPVPEPGTFVMLLAGLAITGAAERRR